MRRLTLLAFVAPLLAALACNDATSPPKTEGLEIRAQHTLLSQSTTPHVSVGNYKTCAVRIDGTMICWGEFDPPAGLGLVTQVSVGDWHTCALKTDGAVVCWAAYDANYYGETSVPDGLGSVSLISAGELYNCALKTNGTVVCWGYNRDGQATVPDDLTSVVQVSAGSVITCALKADGTVVCWGYAGGFLGRNPVPPGLAEVVQVSAGGAHACAVKTDGSLVCWGESGINQAEVPAALGPVIDVSAGYDYTCAVKTDRTVVCWGDYTWGQIDVPDDLSSVAQVSAGTYNTCALKLDGTVVCWGSRRGEVPTGLNLNSAAPNQPPVVAAIASAVAPVQVNTTITASANFTDPGMLDTHTAFFNWGDGTSSAATVNGAGGSGSASGSHVYSTTGVYTITLTVTDNHGAAATSVFEFVVVFDPAAGFATGSGWINSPAGAYARDVTLSGRATFGFVSRYEKGASVPSGNTHFQFHAGDLSFKSTAYDWLVIAGPQAKYKGSGTIDGAGDFGFLLSAVDGDVSGGGGTDKFRIKIWDKVTGAVIYDNQTGASDDAAATTVIAAGSIAIHK